MEVGANRIVHALHLYVLSVSVGSFPCPANGRHRTNRGDDFLACTNSERPLPAAGAQHIGHSATFPKELPRRSTEPCPIPGSPITAVTTRSARQRSMRGEGQRRHRLLLRAHLEILAAEG